MPSEGWAEPRRAAAASSATRRVRAELRAELASGHLTLEDVLLPVAPILVDRTLVEVVRWQWADTGVGARPALEELGGLAVRDGVNLLLAAGHASAYTRAWVVEHGTKWTRRRAAA